MPEGLLGSVLGGEEAEEASSKVGPEALVAAVAADTVQHNPEVAAEAVALFRKQTQVLELQRKTLDAELDFFRVEWRPRLLGLRLRVGFQIFAVFATTILAMGAVIAIRDAVNSRSVVIDAFDIAPNVTAQVPSGKIVASGLLDVLTRIQAATRTSAERRQLSNAWTSDIAIEVPETGVSIGQLERMLRTRFGHDQHIGGDLVQTEKGKLALTVRGPGILPKTFADEARNLDQLLIEAGEYVYGQSQPGLWAAYLSNNDRYDEAIRFAQGELLVSRSQRATVCAQLLGGCHHRQGQRRGDAPGAPALSGGGPAQT